jgi:hypothetical protein
MRRACTPVGSKLSENEQAINWVYIDTERAHKDFWAIE